MKTKLMRIANKWLLLVVLMFTNFITWAQEEGGSIVTKQTTSTTREWYTSPWAWVIGAAVFILLFAAIIRGGDRRTDA